jgi:hypothetical protein
MSVCRVKFLRRKEGKLLRHQFDVKDAFARHQETVFCQVRQGALDLGTFGPTCFWWAVLRPEGGIVPYVTVVKIESDTTPFILYVMLAELCSS